MINKSISELEQQTMNIVWMLKKCSVRDVLTRLNTRKKLAYTTVATLLQRLHKKGLVNRNNKHLTLLYSPKMSKELYGRQLAEQLTNDFLKSFGDTGIASFAESIDKLPKQKREYFLKLLNKKNEVK